MKITDQEILYKIFISTAEMLPYMATHNYFGNKRGLGPTDEWSQKYATQICTAFRESRFKTGLSSTQSMKRITKLIDKGDLVADKHRPGDSFHFSLPAEATRPMFERAFELMIENGITKEPKDATGFDDVAKKVSSALILEFSGEFDRRAA